MTGQRTDVIITGASGFIGSALARALAEAGIAVTAVARSAVTAPHPLVHSLRVDQYEMLASMPELLARTRTIFHLADCADRKAYNANSSENAAALIRTLAAAAAHAGVPRLVLASSVYAEWPERSVYGHSKQAAEHSLLRAMPSLETAIALRLPSVYGPGSGGMFASLARHIRARHPLPLGIANAPRRFLGIENLIDLARHLATADALASGIYAPADPELISLKELALLLSTITGHKPLLVPVPFIDILSRDTIIDPAAAQRNRSAIDKNLGWRALCGAVEQLGYLSS